MEFVLIRHTRCDVAPGTCYGRLDVALAGSAAADIERTLSQVPRVDSVVCSPAQRCHLLALEIARRDGCDVRVLSALQELDFGAWEGRHGNDIPRSESDAWAADPWHRAPPQGETENELWLRTATAAADLIRSAGTARIGVVSHGGPLRILRCLLTRRPVDERWSLSMECGEVVLVRPEGRHATGT